MKKSNNIYKNITPKRSLTFDEILDGEFRSIVEAIEWGCSDSDIEVLNRQDLYRETGYKWVE